MPLQRIVSTCLSGLTGRIRATLVREERILADPKLAEAGGQVDEPLGACWEEMLKAGPYDFGDKVVYSFRRVSVTWASLTSPWSSSSTASLPSTK